MDNTAGYYDLSSGDSGEPWFLSTTAYGIHHGNSGIDPNDATYNDVPTTHWAAAWIKQLGVEGISYGCGGGNYCPESSVTRAQMAGLLVRTFNLP